MRRLSSFVLTGVLWALGVIGVPDTVGQPAPSKEYQVKAAFLYSFSRFVDWPAEAFPEANTPFVIGVLGENPFGGYLAELVQGEKITNRPVVIQHFQRVEDIKSCHILFLGKSEATRMEQIIAELKKLSVLTVSEEDAARARPEMITLIMTNNKIRFKLNLEAARAAGLKISSKLIRTAENSAALKD